MSYMLFYYNFFFFNKKLTLTYYEGVLTKSDVYGVWKKKK